MFFVSKLQVILTQGNTLRAAMPEVRETPVRAAKATQETERQLIVKAPEEEKGQVGGPDGAAARLGLKRTTLQSRIRKYNIAREYR